MAEDPVVLALRSAIERADSLELRRALGEHLLKTGALREALGEFERALELGPDDREALAGAAAAANATGNTAKAQAYQLALGAGRAASPVPAQTQSSPPELTPAPAPIRQLRLVRAID